MYLKILVNTVTFVLFFQTSLSKLRDDQKDNSFDTISSNKEAEVQYATVTEIDTSDLRPFRKRPATIVQYQVTLDNETFTITLRPNKHLLSPGCLIHSYLQGVENEKDIYPCSRERLECYYTGSSDSHNESWVAANICNGLNGVISFENTSLFIKPININGSGKSPQGNVHAVYRFEGDKQMCPVEDKTSGHQLHVVYGKQKRAVQTRYIRTRLIVDPAMFHFHGTRDSTVAYTMMAFNIASKLYSDPSIGTRIHLTLSDLHIIEPYNDLASELTENANRTLKTFCDWQSKLQSEADCSVLLTRLDLETDYGGRGINGLAHPKAMCDKNLHCAIVEDEGPSVGITMAHEIGHLLGMTHDKGPGGVGIMSSGGWSGREAFTWSNQSASELQSSLTSTEMSCLRKRSEVSNENDVEFPLPGTLYTADQQCKMRKNDSYEFYRDSATITDPCRNIACRVKDNQPLLISSPLLDGTDCNNTRMWCIRGQCVVIDQQHASISPVDGAWSQWDTGYTACSRSCGGGVQIKRRYCNNPSPQYGGKDCPGMPTLEKICNIQACDSDYRAEQCTELAMLAGVGGNVYPWIPALGYIGDDSCTIRCKDDLGRIRTMSGNNYYRDGTECLMNETVPFSRCVNGKCLDFGCDGNSYSGLKYDNCGVCNGTGSTCFQRSGTYNKDDSPGIYTNVTVIPAGSSGVHIQQSNKYCFLSLLVDGNRILNSNMKKAMSSALFNLYGIQFRYTTKPETIEIIGTITKPIIIQVFRLWDYQAYSNVSPEVNYTYYVPDPQVQQSYAWAELPNQLCSRSCGTGVTSRTVACMSVKGQFVEEFHCDAKTRPKIKYTACNTQPCPPSWKASEWGNCSVPCGEGRKSRSVTCVRTVNKNDQVVPSTQCDVSTKPHNITKCYNVCEWKTGSWSQCTTTCGEGYRIRRVSCFRRYVVGPRVDSQFCDQNNIPYDTYRCNQGPCYVLDGTCVDRRPDCKKYYEYEASACDGSYKTWMMTNCLKTCGMCANGSCVDEQVCKQVDPNVDACHDPQYAVWMKTHCPQKCNICQDCVDCSKYDEKFCTDSEYQGFMRRHCSKTCKLC